MDFIDRIVNVLALDFEQMKCPTIFIQPLQILFQILPRLVQWLQA